LKDRFRRGVEGDEPPIRTEREKALANPRQNGVHGQIRGEGWRFQAGTDCQFDALDAPIVSFRRRLRNFGIGSSDDG
jgi:hypothetical protein